MEYIQLTNEHCVHHYGLIQNPKNRNTLLMYSQEQKLASFPIITDESIVTVLNIQGEFAYVRNECPQGIQEYNDTLRILTSNKTARWRFQEIEYKFNILNNLEDFFYFCSSLCNFLDLLSHIRLSILIVLRPCFIPTPRAISLCFDGRMKMNTMPLKSRRHYLYVPY